MKIFYSAGNMAELFTDLATDAGSCICGFVLHRQVTLLSTN